MCVYNTSKMAAEANSSLKPTLSAVISILHLLRHTHNIYRRVEIRKKFKLKKVDQKRKA